ncbi:MAG: hypothetical protein AAF327_18070 [Cyanobacteria bacterium P01_A01_bin.37]
MPQFSHNQSNLVAKPLPIELQALQVSRDGKEWQRPLPHTQQGFHNSLPILPEIAVNGLIYVPKQGWQSDKVPMLITVGCIGFIVGAVVMIFGMASFFSRPIITNPQPNITEINPRCRLFCGD